MPICRRRTVKTAIHPDIVQTTVFCASCGARWEARSTRASLTLDTCAGCHSAYTGVEPPRARGDRVERFERRRRLATVGR